VFFHRQGEIRDRTFENQSFRENWKWQQKVPILPFMDDTPHHKPPADCNPPMPSAADLLAESEAELAAGLTMDGDALIRELYASADQLEAEQHSRKAAHRR
jgi:hypothetical protein